VGTVLLARRDTDRPLFGAIIRLGMAPLVVRLLFGIVFGTGQAGGATVLAIPAAPLPDWAGGLTIGGPVTTDGLLAVLSDGLLLATIFACVGVANALADPRELLRSVPGALYEVGVSVVVALSFAPRLVADARRVRTARRLRGQRSRGLRALTRTAMPVLEGGLEQALDLAASMDARGYGRRSRQSPGSRAVSGVGMLAGLALLAFGLLGLLGLVADTAVALACVLAGLTATAVGLMAGSRNTRSRFRPASWGPAEMLLLVAAFALAAVYLSVTGGAGGPSPLAFDPADPRWTPPLTPMLALVLMLTPAALTRLDRSDRP
jgi:energy-coupling factor transport system permease protein